MKDFPSDLISYKLTPEFSENTIPAGLQNSHSTKAGVWAKIIILEGELMYRILEPAIEETCLSQKVFGVVEPEVPHEVAVIGPVRFYVEFYRRRTIE